LLLWIVKCLVGCVMRSLNICVMTSTTVSEDFMKTLKMVIELTYDDDGMHGDDQDSIDWFENDILLQKAEGEELFLHSKEINDTIGAVKVLSISC